MPGIVAVPEPSITVSAPSRTLAGGVPEPTSLIRSPVTVTQPGSTTVKSSSSRRTAVFSIRISIPNELFSDTLLSDFPIRK